MEKHELNIYGFTYEINAEKEKAVSVYKIVGGQKIPLTKEELEKIVKLLNEQAKNAPQYQYNEQDVDNISIESIVEIIKSKIDSNEFRTSEDINNYLNSLNIEQKNKDIIINNVQEYIQSKFQKQGNNDIKDCLEKFIENLHKRRDKNEYFYASLEVSSGIAKFQMYNYNAITKQYTKTEADRSFNYTEEFKKDFLENVAVEFAKDSTVSSCTVTPQGFLEADVVALNQNNASLKLGNIERSYSYEIEKKIKETKSLNVNTIKEYEEEETLSQEEQFDKDLGQYASLSEEERIALEQDKGITRKLVKDNQSGKMNRIYIFIFIIVAIALLTLLLFKLL